MRAEQPCDLAVFLPLGEGVEVAPGAVDRLADLGGVQVRGGALVEAARPSREDPLDRVEVPAVEVDIDAVAVCNRQGDTGLSPDDPSAGGGKDVPGSDLCDELIVVARDEVGVCWWGHHVLLS